MHNKSKQLTYFRSVYYNLEVTLPVQKVVEMRSHTKKGVGTAFPPNYSPDKVIMSPIVARSVASLYGCTTNLNN